MSADDPKRHADAPSAPDVGDGEGRRKRLPPEEAEKLRTAPDLNKKKLALDNLDEAAFGRGPDADLVQLCIDALDAQRGVRDEDLTHGLHAWPARMHHRVPRTVLSRLPLDDDSVVLDPFMGSGTVLVESLVKGVPAVGTDLNPLAQRVARVKCRVADADERDAFLALVHSVVDKSKDRVRNKVAIQAQLSKAECEHYQPHVLKELAGLMAEIDAVAHKQHKRLLKTLFSSMVVKFSKARSDTDGRHVKKSIGKYIPSEFFGEKGAQWVKRWQELDDVVARPLKHPLIIEGNANHLPQLLDAKKNHPHLKGRRPSVVITSPPYAGTYDYVEHHLRRTAWLGLDMKPFAGGEIGARRDLSYTEDKADAQVKKRKWDDQVKAYLTSLHNVVADGAHVFLLVGDGRIGPTLIPADKQLERHAPDVGFDVAAIGSSRRPDFTGKHGRHEHLICLVKGTS